jgi:hypothetical protein
MYAAAAYNALWGLGVVVLAGPVAWKCVGMLVACYAPGYWWAVWWPAFVAYLRRCWGPKRRRAVQDRGTRVTDAPATRSG